MTFVHSSIALCYTALYGRLMDLFLRSVTPCLGLTTKLFYSVKCSAEGSIALSCTDNPFTILGISFNQL